MIACPEPAFNLTALKDEGYENPLRLWVGNIGWKTKRNSSRMINTNFWGGKKNRSQSRLLESGNVIGNYQWVMVDLLPLRIAYPLDIGIHRSLLPAIQETI